MSSHTRGSSKNRSKIKSKGFLKHGLDQEKHLFQELVKISKTQKIIFFKGFSNIPK